MLTKFFINMFHIFVEVTLWLCVLLAIGIWIGITLMGDLGIASVFVGGVVGFIFLFAATLFVGSFLILHDIREKIRHIELIKKIEYKNLKKQT